jgi:hypothetical protein
VRRKRRPIGRGIDQRHKRLRGRINTDEIRHSVFSAAGKETSESPKRMQNKILANVVDRRILIASDQAANFSSSNSSPLT